MDRVATRGAVLPVDTAVEQLLKSTSADAICSLIAADFERLRQQPNCTDVQLHERLDELVERVSNRQSEAAAFRLIAKSFKDFRTTLAPRNTSKFRVSFGRN